MIISECNNGNILKKDCILKINMVGLPSIRKWQSLLTSRCIILPPNPSILSTCRSNRVGNRNFLHIFVRGSGQNFYNGISSWVWQISKNFDQSKVIRNWNTLTFLKLQEFDIAYFYTVTIPKNRLFISLNYQYLCIDTISFDSIDPSLKNGPTA